MNSKATKNVICALAFALVALHAQAAFTPAQKNSKSTFMSRFSAASRDPYEYEINRLIQLQDFRGNFTKTFKTTMEQFVANGMITTSQLDAIAEEITDVAYPILTEAVGKCLRQNLSVDELRQVNAFYETPVGKKMNALLPTLMQTGLEAMQKPEIQAKIQQVVKKHLVK